MNTGQQFKHYVWIVNVLRKRGRLTLKELQELWVLDEVADGNPLPRSSFHKYRDAIFDMFGLVIECDKTHHYFISNPGDGQPAGSGNSRSSGGRAAGGIDAGGMCR